MHVVHCLVVAAVSADAFAAAAAAVAVVVVDQRCFDCSDLVVVVPLRLDVSPVTWRSCRCAGMTTGVQGCAMSMHVCLLSNLRLRNVHIQSTKFQNKNKNKNKNKNLNIFRKHMRTLLVDALPIS